EPMSNATRLSPEELGELTLSDRLNAIPTLILLSAVDPGFPGEDSWIYSYMRKGSADSLWIDFAEIHRRPGITGWMATVIKLADDIWSGGSKTSLTEALRRCDIEVHCTVLNAMLMNFNRG